MTKHPPELEAVANIFEQVLAGFDFERGDHQAELFIPAPLKIRAMEVFLQRLHVWRLNLPGAGELVPIQPGAPDDELEHWFDVMLQTLGELGIWMAPSGPSPSSSR